MKGDPTHTIAVDQAGSGRQSSSPQVLRATLALRDLILRGELPAGRRLSEPQLVRRVGVSRTPLRLAMEILEHEGVVERRPQGGFTVRSFTVSHIEEAVMPAAFSRAPSPGSRRNRKACPSTCRSWSERSSKWMVC
jgi:DNA-binding GntR family transcriptional regulator